MPIHVFLSVGRTATPKQEAFVRAVQDFLTEHGLEARTVGRTDFTYQKPLQLIAEVMRQCQGTIVIAFERLYVAQGLELRGSPDAAPLSGLKLPTVWTQIEAAMAYTLGHPLLAIVESDLRSEGVLEEGYDWYIKWVDLTPASLQEPAFLKTFAAWRERVAGFER